MAQTLIDMERALYEEAGVAAGDVYRRGRVTGRVDEDGSVTLGITAATATPTVLRYPTLPHRDRLHDDVVAAPGYYSDPLGAADWRRATTATLAEEIRTELSGAIR